MRARRIFFEGLATFLGAGIPVRTALADLSSRAGGSFGEAVLHLRTAVDAGRPLSDGMEERPAAFRRFEVELVRAGESSGTLEKSVRVLAAEEEAAERVRNRILAALAYPVLVLHAVPVPVGFAAGSFLPFALPWYACLWAALGLGWWLLREARTGGPGARVLLAVPFVGGLLRDRALLRWARVFAALEDAGVGPEPCAVRAAASTGLSVLEAPLAAPALRLRAGVSRAEAFAGTPLPPTFLASIAQGEVAGTIAASLRKSADLLEASLDARMDATLALLPAVATVIAGAGVLYAAVRVIGGYYSLR